MHECDVLVLHNNPGIAAALATDIMEDGILAVAQYDPKRALEFMDTTMRPRVVVVHKGLDDYSGMMSVDNFIDAVRQTHEWGPIVRLGIVSSEFFGGRVCQRALSLGADFGWDPTVSAMQPVPEWVKRQIRLGYLHPAELTLRGKETVITPADARAREAFVLSLLHGKERE